MDWTTEHVMDHYCSQVKSSSRWSQFSDALEMFHEPNILPHVLFLSFSLISICKQNYCTFLYQCLGRLSENPFFQIST